MAIVSVSPRFLLCFRVSSTLKTDMYYVSILSGHLSLKLLLRDDEGYTLLFDIVLLRHKVKLSWLTQKGNQCTVWVGCIHQFALSLHQYFPVVSALCYSQMLSSYQVFKMFKRIYLLPLKNLDGQLYLTQHWLQKSQIQDVLRILYMEYKTSAM